MMCSHASSVRGRKARERTTDRTFEGSGSFMDPPPRKRPREWLRKSCYSFSSRDIDLQHSVEQYPPSRPSTYWGGYQTWAGTASGAWPGRRWLPKAKGLTQAHTSCRSWQRRAAPPRTGPSSPPRPSPLPVSRGWERSPQSVAPVCDRDPFRTGGSNGMSDGYPEMWGVTSRSGSSGSGRHMLDARSSSAAHPSWRREWLASSRGPYMPAIGGIVGAARGRHSCAGKACPGDIYAGGGAGPASAWPTRTLPPPTSLSSTRYRDCRGRRLQECAGTQWRWRISGRDPSSTCASRTTDRSDLPSRGTSVHGRVKTPSRKTPPPSTVSAEPGRAPVGSRPSKVRKRPSVTEPRVPGAVPLAPSPPTRSSVSAAERGPQDSADAPEPHLPARTARSSASKFVGRLRGSATGARPCPKRAVSRLLKPSKPLLVGRPGASRGGPSGLPQGQAMAGSRFRRLEASSAGPSLAPVAAPVIDLTG